MSRNREGVGSPWRCETALSESLRWGRGEGSMLCPHEVLDGATLGEYVRRVGAHFYDVRSLKTQFAVPS